MACDPVGIIESTTTFLDIILKSGHFFMFLLILSSFYAWHMTHNVKCVFVCRHEIAEIAGVISVSCYNGQSTEKHVVLFKKDSCPGEEELKKRRLGEVNDNHSIFRVDIFVHDNLELFFLCH